MCRTERIAWILGALLMCVSLAGCGGGGNSSSNSPPPPSPSTITAISPASAIVGGAGFTLSVTGSGFARSSTVLWNGNARPTTFVSSASLTALITANDISIVGSGNAQISVSSPGSGSSSSAPVVFRILNPPPVISSLSPESILAGSSQVGVTVEGSGLVLDSVVQWNGNNRATSFQIGPSGPLLIASIPASDLVTAGVAQITVSNPAPGGGTSAAVPFAIRPTNPAPLISSVPGVYVIPPDRNQATWITIQGSGFVESSVVQWNGRNLNTLGGLSNTLLAEYLRSDVATAGTANITVVNPSPGGGTSNVFLIPIVNPIPEVFSLEPTTILAGSPDFTLAVAGYFVGNSVVRWNGVGLNTSVVDNGQSQLAIATVPAVLVASPGTAQIELASPAPGGGTATVGTFTIEAAPTDNGKLNGQYAFVFSGFNSGVSMSAVGSFVADGNGHVAGGIADVAVAGATSTDQGLIPSAYSVGSDNSGTLSLQTAVNSPTGSFRFTFSFALSSFSSAGVAVVGRLIESGNTGQAGTGFFIRQDPAAFSTAAINGGYAFRLAGPDGIFENVALGRFTAGGGSLSAGHVDVIGFGGGGVDLPFTGTYSVDSSGRGAAALNIVGRPSALNLILYVVSTGELLWMEAGGTGATGKAL